MKNLVNREDAKNAKGIESLRMLGLNHKDFAVLRELRGFAVKEGFL